MEMEGLKGMKEACLMRVSAKMEEIRALLWKEEKKRMEMERCINNKIRGNLR